MRILPALLLVVVTACGSKPAPSAPHADPAPVEAAAPVAEAEQAAGAVSDAELEAAIDEMFGVMERVADAASANVDDCAKAAAAIKQIVAENQVVFTKAKEMEARDPTISDRADKMMEPRMEKLRAIMGKMMPVGMKCETNPAFVDAMTSLQR